MQHIGPLSLVLVYSQATWIPLSGSTSTPAAALGARAMNSTCRKDQARHAVLCSCNGVPSRLPQTTNSPCLRLHACGGVRSHSATCHPHAGCTGISSSMPFRPCIVGRSAASAKHDTYTARPASCLSLSPVRLFRHCIPLAVSRLSSLSGSERQPCRSTHAISRAWLSRPARLAPSWPAMFGSKLRLQS